LKAKSRKGGRRVAAGYTGGMNASNTFYGGLN